MKNQVIEVLTNEHGKRVIQYWRDRGIDTMQHLGWNNDKAVDSIWRYYGVINEKFNNYNIKQVKEAGAEIIELPGDSKSVTPNSEIKPTYAGMKCSYKGDLAGVPDPIVHKMLEYQELHGNPRDVSVFEKRYYSGILFGGFTWSKTPEGNKFWAEVLADKNFDTFFKRYPELMPDTDTFDIQAALTRIESKLDLLLAEKADPEEVNKVDDFSVGDKVRVKSWKEIKAMTKKDEDGDRVYSDGSVFLKSEKIACGKIGEVILSIYLNYVPVRGEGWEYRLASQALEKI